MARWRGRDSVISQRRGACNDVLDRFRGVSRRASKLARTDIIQVMPGSEQAARSACVFLRHDQHALAPRDYSAGTTAVNVRDDAQPMLCCRVYDPRLCRRRCAAPFATDEPVSRTGWCPSARSSCLFSCQPSAESTAVVIASVLSLPGKAPMPRAVVASIAAMTLQAAVFSPR